MTLPIFFVFSQITIYVLLKIFITIQDKVGIFVWIFTKFAVPIELAEVIVGQITHGEFECYVGNHRLAVL